MNETGLIASHRMDSEVSPTRVVRRAVLFSLGVIGLVSGLYLMVSGIQMEGEQAPPDLLVVQLVLVVWSFLGSGLVALRLRPRNRVGWLLVATGLLLLLDLMSSEVVRLTGSDLVFSVHLIFGQMPFAPLGHLLLAFPTGKLTSNFQRAVAGLLYIWVGFLANLFRALFTDYRPRNEGLCADCVNVFMIRDDPAVHGIFVTADMLIGVALAVSVVVVVVRRWAAASEAMRRVLRPIWWGLWPVMLVVAYVVALDAVDMSVQFRRFAIPFLNLALTVLPLTFLWGLLRTRLDRSLVGDLLIGLEGPMGHGQIREALSQALGDASLRLAFWLPDQKRYVDEEGGRLDLPDEAVQDRHLTEIEDSEGNPLAVLIHDPALLEDRERVDAVAGAARLALENERLHAELQAQLQEVRESRARVVEAGDTARQRLERDLHDGAQQRLLALSLAIERARTLGDGEDRSRLEGLLAEASAELKETLAELRELARGIHPALLTDEGLGPAVEALARRAALPTRLLDAPSERFSPAVEAAAYFIVSEGLANAAKHSKASEATVSIRADHGWLVVEVMDDGDGGAKFDGGSGLLGLEDRVVSLGGDFVLRSSPGMGTSIQARLPRDHQTTSAT